MKIWRSPIHFTKILMVTKIKIKGMATPLPTTVTPPTAIPRTTRTSMINPAKIRFHKKTREIVIKSKFCQCNIHHGPVIPGEFLISLWLASTVSRFSCRYI